MSTAEGAVGDVLERELGKETQRPPQRKEQRGLFPRRGPAEDVGGVAGVVHERGERNKLQRQRRGRRRHKLDERAHDRCATRIIPRCTGKHTASMGTTSVSFV
jgi:hypothetical protein